MQNVLGRNCCFQKEKSIAYSLWVVEMVNERAREQERKRQEQSEERLILKVCMRADRDNEKRGGANNLGA